MTRDELTAFRNTAIRELAMARRRGLSDKEILEALRAGNRAQKNYADFIEFQIMKAG